MISKQGVPETRAVAQLRGEAINGVGLLQERQAEDAPDRQRDVDATSAHAPVSPPAVIEKHDVDYTEGAVYLKC